MMAGTFGYMAPEMHYTGKATKESDMYSFGVLMLEVLCGRKPLKLQVEDPDEDFMLVQNLWRAHESGSNILGAVDRELLMNLHLHQLKPSRSSTASSNQITQLNYSPLNALCSSNLIPSRYRYRGYGFQCQGKNCASPSVGLVVLLGPESRPSMRVVKQVILQVQGSTGEDTMTMLSPMPPLPFDRETSDVQRSNTTSVLRRQISSDDSA